MEDVNAVYADGKMTFTVAHFSNYVIVDETVVKDNDNSNTGDDNQNNGKQNGGNQNNGGQNNGNQNGGNPVSYTHLDVHKRQLGYLYGVSGECAVPGYRLYCSTVYRWSGIQQQ